ncbi:MULTISPECIES: hypothetical protein [Clostridium]|uniref:hypothetical protein n=1 Tax=Clostridium TaxID=1485 RepID=UPI001FA9809A|nr:MULTISPECIES: hypothetical protein [Clostridium]
MDRQPGTSMSPAVHQNYLKIGQKRAQKWVKDGKGLAVSMQDKERCAAAVLFIVDFCAGGGEIAGMFHRKSASFLVKK